jgi:putative membrane protein
MLINQTGMTIVRWLFIGAALVGIAAINVSLTGCSSKADADDTAVQTQAVTVEALSLSSAGKEFLVATFENGLLELGAAKLAAKKSDNVHVKQFAELMYQSYSRSNDSVRQIAFANDFDLPTQPDARGQALLQKLARLEGAEFDQLYSHEMRKAHKRATQRFAVAADSAPDPVIQTFAQSQLPAIRDRFRIARSLPGGHFG